MKLGIPTWEDRVSPVLDVAKRVLVVDTDGDVEFGRHEVEIDETNLAARVRQIGGLGVRVLICGAVSRPLEEMLGAAGVRVIPHVCGPVEGVLRAFLTGRLSDETFLMPGCCGRRRRLRGGQRRGARSGDGS